MKAMGKGSIASFVKVLLDFVWGAVALGLVLATLLLVYAAFFELPGGSEATVNLAPFGVDIQSGADQGTGTGWHMRIPVVFELDAGAYNVTSPSLGIDRAQIRDVHANLRFPMRRGGFFFANLVMIVVLITLGLWVLAQLRHVFRTLRDGRPFVSANARRIRWIGLAVIFGDLVRAGFVFLESYYTAIHFTANGIRFRTSTDISGTAIVCGLVILVIAEVFREGTRLEEEQSLTV